MLGTNILNFQITVLTNCRDSNTKKELFLV
jgi:hypothetical protein